MEIFTVKRYQKKGIEYINDIEEQGNKDLGYWKKGRIILLNELEEILEKEL